ncbi:MAG: hypothetical protein WKG01_20000 [Kofleriaceae bacterium]
MRTVSALILTAALTATLATPAAADEVAAPTAVRSKTIGIDGGVAMPTGDWGDAAGFGFGALARLEIPFRPAITFTARAGYIYHTSKEAEGGLGGSADSSTSEIPLFAGARYAFSRTATSEIYGAAELGLVMYRVSVDGGGESMSSSNTNLGMTLGAGYRTGKLDLRAGLLFPDVGEVGDAMALMATVGYDITAL